MGFAALTVAAILLVDSSAFRVKPKRKGQRAPPQIDGIFAFAAAAPSDDPLVNPRGGPCFPGIRSANVKQQWFGQEADTATTILGVLGFRHPLMDFKLVDLKDASKNTLYRCASEGEEVGNRPRGLSKIALHDRELYRAAMENMDLGWGDLMRYLTNIGLPESYNYDRNSANANAQQYGWKVIGSAVDEGSDKVGRSVSHLFQNPGSKECMLTFQGSTEPEDWTANLELEKVPFCGYPGVHKGFARALMKMVKASEWQSDVRPNFSKCSKVYVTGHSQGGSEAELFGACVQKAPSQGQDGYDDYKHIGW